MCDHVVCLCTCVHVCSEYCLYALVYIDVHVCTCTCIWMNPCTLCIYVHVCINVHVHVHVEANQSMFLLFIHYCRVKAHQMLKMYFLLEELNLQHLQQSTGDL